MSRDLPEKGGSLADNREKSSHTEGTASAKVLRQEVLACSRTSKEAGMAAAEQLRGEMVREAIGANFKGPAGFGGCLAVTERDEMHRRALSSGGK